MTTPTDPAQAQAQGLSPESLANQLFDAAMNQALMEGKSDPREVARRVINFLMESLVYAVSAAAGDPNARQAMLKSIGDTLATAPALPVTPKP